MLFDKKNYIVTIHHLSTALEILIHRNVKRLTLGEKSTGSTPRQSNTTIVLNLLESSAVYGLMLSCIMSARKKTCDYTWYSFHTWYVSSSWHASWCGIKISDLQAFIMTFCPQMIQMGPRALPFINTSNISLVYISLNHWNARKPWNIIFCYILQLGMTLGLKIFACHNVCTCGSVCNCDNVFFLFWHIQSSDLVTLDDPSHMHEFSHPVYFQNLPLTFTSFSS